MRRNRRWILLLNVLLVCTMSALAQSGRKQKKADPQPPVQGINQPDKRVQNNDVNDASNSSSSTDPEPDEEKNGQKKIQALKKKLLIMSSMPDMNVSLYYADIARQGCASEAHRLAPTLVVTDSSNQTRSDAMRAAKDSDDTYVVLLEIESMMGGGMINGMDLRFTLYEPKTGKQIAFGTGMPRTPSRGVPVPMGGGNRTDVRMDWAARDVADQVISKMNLRPGF
jgi:hypothetical protein